MTNDSSALIVDAPATNAAAKAAELVLRDVKAPVPLPDYFFWIILIGSILLAIGLGLLIWFLWLRKKFLPQPLPPLPPHVRARRKLREALALLNEPEPFTVFVSSTIRQYLEERFEFRAPERTTEEFLYELQSTKLLTQQQKNSLGDFLSQCDLIKFAKYDPTKPELEQLHQSAMSLVEETEPRPMAGGTVQPNAAEFEKK